MHVKIRLYDAWLIKGNIDEKTLFIIKEGEKPNKPNKIK